MQAASSVERKARSQAFARFQQPVETPNERRNDREPKRRRAIHFSTRVFTFGFGQLVNAPPHSPRPPRGHPDSRFDFRFKRRTRLSNKIVADLRSPDPRWYVSTVSGGRVQVRGRSRPKRNRRFPIFVTISLPLPVVVSSSSGRWLAADRRRTRLTDGKNRAVPPYHRGR